jgi:hypothetical protein
VRRSDPARFDTGRAVLFAGAAPVQLLAADPGRRSCRIGIVATPGGGPIVTNLARDPTGAVAVLWWNSTNANDPVSPPDTTTARPGALTVDSVRAISGAAPGSFSLLTNTTTGAIIPITVGQQYTVSVWAKTDAAGQNCRINLRWRDPTNTVLVLNDLAPVVTNLTAGAWVRLVYSSVAPAGSAFLQAGVIFSAIPTASSGWVDDIMVTAGTTDWAYGDGGYPGWTWNGATNLSTSYGPDTAPGLDTTMAVILGTRRHVLAGTGYRVGPVTVGASTVDLDVSSTEELWAAVTASTGAATVTTLTTYRG